MKLKPIGYYIWLTIRFVVMPKDTIKMFKLRRDLNKSLDKMEDIYKD